MGNSTVLGGMVLWSLDPPLQRLSTAIEIHGLSYYDHNLFSMNKVMESGKVA